MHIYLMCAKLLARRHAHAVASRFRDSQQRVRVVELVIVPLVCVCETHGQLLLVEKNYTK
jgi:hypothetical protein